MSTWQFHTHRAYAPMRDLHDRDALLESEDPVVCASFDGAGLHAHLDRQLPRYARPAFVRVVPAIDVTGTQKQRKVGLADEGYDPGRIRDPLYVRDDETGTYAPLTTERFAARRWRL
jgi:hypothetical protein